MAKLAKKINHPMANKGSICHDCISNLYQLTVWFSIPDCVTEDRTTYLFVFAIWESPVKIKTLHYLRKSGRTTTCGYKGQLLVGTIKTEFLF